METKDILFYIGCASLITVALIIVINFTKLYRYQRFQKRRSDVKIACAGSGESEYPYSEHFRNSELAKVRALIDSQKKPELYTPYLVKGNSMQYANLRPDDIVIAKRQDIRVSEAFPRIVVIKIDETEANECNYKIRRAWDVVDSDTTEQDFSRIVDAVLASEKFALLRERAQEKCPTNEEMKTEIMTGFRNYDGEGDVLLSTTYKTDIGRIHFSLHAASSVAGVVEYVSAAPKQRRSQQQSIPAS